VVARQTDLGVVGREFSAASSSVLTRVMSAWNARNWRSNISRRVLLARQRIAERAIGHLGCFDRRRHSRPHPV
jgi:hypothetical protein